MEILQTRIADTTPARGKSERALIEARNAVQWLARVTRSYAAVPSAETSLIFDPASRRVMTPEVAPGIRLGLHLPSLVFQFEENGKPTPHAFDVDDKSTAEVEAWLLAELLHRGFDRDRFDKRLPYAWPHPMSGDEIKYAAHDLARELDELTQRLATAATCLLLAKQSLELERSANPSDRASMAFFPDAFAIGFSEPSTKGAVRTRLELKEAPADEVYRVTADGFSARDVAIAASGAGLSNEIIAQKIADAVKSMQI